MRDDGAPSFHFPANRGSYSVGLRVVELYDHSRSFRGQLDVLGHPSARERARPLQTLIWYPAQATAARPMTVRDYAGLWANEISFDHPRIPIKAKEWISGLEATLDTSLWATRDAAEASGAFPVLIYAPSFSSMSWENADLCEYLASHGYVVLATASIGAATRSMTLDLAGLNAQADDISFLIGYARTLANADLSNVAVAGFSWGGLANLFAASRDNRIHALIALDGSLRFWPGMVRQGNIRPSQMTIPLLSFAKREWNLEEQARFLTAEQLDGPNVLNAWTHGDLIAVYMLKMTHRQFSSMAQRNEEFWSDSNDPDFADRQIAAYGREDAHIGYGWVARYTLEFLNAYLKQSAASMKFLSTPPKDNGVPKCCMDLTYRAAAGVPASCEGFRAEIGREGFDRCTDVHAAMARHDAGFKLSEVYIDDWAEELLDEQRCSEALALLRLNANIHPNSSHAHASLGRALRLSGQDQAAIESYRRAVQLNRANAEAKRVLRDLERDGGTLGSR